MREGGRITSLFAVFCVSKCPLLFDKFCLMMIFVVCYLGNWNVADL